MSAQDKLTPGQVLQSILVDAQHKALVSLVLSIAEKLKLKSEEGLTPGAWYRARILFVLEKHTLAVGDSNPPLAAELQMLIAGLKLP